ncbi:MAG: hypothetical protein M0T74_10515 [Desulfitobacterium hafniense]|nr:hypothetical protein [Desulfitobacterium hafniense]
MTETKLEPIDYCGCGDIGYLAAKTLPIDLEHGVGQILNVPIYTCQARECAEYTIPESVSKRLDELAEKMEATKSLELKFTWGSGQDNKPQNPETNELNPLLLSFTLKFLNRNYEDAEVVNVIPGSVIILRSIPDPSEYFLLQFEYVRAGGAWFSFSKFYYDDELSSEMDTLVDQLEMIQTKELALLLLDEIEEVLVDEFGEILN